MKKKKKKKKKKKLSLVIIGKCGHLRKRTFSHSIPREIHKIIVLFLGCHMLALIKYAQYKSINKKQLKLSFKWRAPIGLVIFDNYI